MKIKRFLAPDIRQALQRVKETLGADAVILSNRKIPEGVEIIATRDFDLETVTPAEPKPARSKPAAKVLPGKLVADPPEPATQDSATAPVTPKPAFSAHGYRAVAELAAPKNPQETIKTPVFPRVQTRSEVPVAKRRTDRERFQSGKPSRHMGEVRSTHASQPNPAPATPAARPSGREEPLASLRRELQQMRRLLDRHLSQTTWREVMREYPTRLDLLRALNGLGFAKHLALELAQRAGVHEDFIHALDQVREILTGRFSVYEDPLLDYGGIVALVGPTGVGKTTTVAKLAARFRLKHGPRQIALVTTDNYRIAAHEQLSTYARILGVPVRVAGNAEELHTILRGFLDKQLVLIDTAGMSPRDLRLAEQFALLRDSDMVIETYLVLSAGAQLPSLYEAIDAFAGCQPRAAILTKLDEAGCLGPVLSALIERGLPAAYFTDGQQVPEDLHPVRAEILVQRCFETAPAASQSADMDFDIEDWIAHASA